LLKPDCVTCNTHERQLNNDQCSDCKLLLSASNYRNENQQKRRPRPALSAEFKKYGITQPSHVGKHQLYFFLHHSYLNFKFPDFPDFDMFGNPKKDSWVYHIHHLNRIWYDDSSTNLVALLPSEHPFFEKSNVIKWRWKY